jgi:ABC-2 type transport system permease protein
MSRSTPTTMRPTTSTDTSNRPAGATRRHWFPVTVQMAARKALAEPGPTLVALAFYVVVVATLSGIWRVAADANGGSLAGYTAVALTWYIATTEAATVSLNVRMIDDIGHDIASGTVAVELLRPAPVLGIRVATELGRALPRLAGCAGVGVLVAVLTAGAPPDALGLLLAAPSLVLAISCNILAQHAFAAAAFWLRDAGSAWFLYLKLVFVLGGMLIPLETLPSWLESTAAVLPFRAMAYAPARLAAGHIEPMLLLEQVVWLAALLVAACVAFGAGERRLQVVGG